MRGTLLGILCGLGAAAIWGGMYVVSDVVLEVIPPFLLLTTRIGLGIFTLWVATAHTKIKLTQKQILQITGAGLIGYGLSLGLQFVGTQRSTAANGALITSTTPAFVLLFAGWLLGERITPRIR